MYMYMQSDDDKKYSKKRSLSHGLGYEVSPSYTPSVANSHRYCVCTVYVLYMYMYMYILVVSLFTHAYNLYVHSSTLSVY